MDNLNLPSIEEWRAVPGYGGLYEVSNLGRVRSCARNWRTGVWRILKPVFNGDYFYFRFYYEGKYRNILAHILVASVFLGPCPEGYEVNHIDGVKINNQESNLEYLTRGDNLRHAYRLGLGPDFRGEKSPRASLNRTQAREVFVLFHLESKSYQEIANLFGIDDVTVWRIIHGVTYRSIFDEIFGG